MANDVVDEDGYVYKRGWDGQYHQVQGWLGPKQALDFLGNPKVDQGILGGPNAKTDFLGGQARGSGGEPLYTSGSGDILANAIGTALAWILVGLVQFVALAVKA